MPPFDYGDLEFTQPAKQIKAFNMGPVPQRIFDDMRKYENSARGIAMPSLLIALVSSFQVFGLMALRTSQTETLALAISSYPIGQPTPKSRSFIASRLIPKLPILRGSLILI
jgi:hypothetical protein